MNEPRPAMISARPSDSRSSWANASNTRTGSSELRTVTAFDRRMRSVLAAAAAKTERIRLSNAVTVLSSDDPVRVFEAFAQLDLLSDGRAEIMAGRGSFIESFPLFGYALADYDDLFAENLQLLLRIRESERVTWPGGHRAAIPDRGVYPRPVQQPLPVWIAVGGTPESVYRAGTLGLPVTIAIIGGAPERFAPLVQLHRDAAQQAGHPPLPGRHQLPH